MKVIDLYWENGRTGCIAVIKEDIDEETVKTLVDEYKKSDPRLYNTYDALHYISQHGYTIELIICYDSQAPVNFDNIDYSIPF